MSGTEDKNSTHPLGGEAHSEVRRLIREQTLEKLNPRQKPEFLTEMAAFHEWLKTKGVNIEDEEGQTLSTAENNLRRVTRILSTIWNAHNGYTLQISSEMCDWYVSQLDDDEITKENGGPYANSTKRKHVCALLALSRFQWDERSGEAWEPAKMFGSNSRPSPIADPLTLDERTAVREASLEYKTLKQYNNCSPRERDRFKAYLAQRLEKPKSEITKSDWQQVTRSWKVPALIMLGLDLGLRPMEVKRAKTSWLKLSSLEIEIPSEDAVKNDETWTNAITERTAQAVRRWLEQRKTRPKYDETDLLFLTRESNPYSSGPLGRLLRGVMDEAGAEYSDRDISWYSLRHSLGTQLVREGDLKQVQKQLRHKSIESTFKYLHPPSEEIRDSLDKIS